LFVPFTFVFIYLHFLQFILLFFSTQANIFFLSFVRSFSLSFYQSFFISFFCSFLLLFLFQAVMNAIDAPIWFIVNEAWHKTKLISYIQTEAAKESRRISLQLIQSQSFRKYFYCQLTVFLFSSKYFWGKKSSTQKLANRPEINEPRNLVYPTCRGDVHKRDEHKNDHYLIIKRKCWKGFFFRSVLHFLIDAPNF